MVLQDMFSPDQWLGLATIVSYLATMPENAHLKDLFLVSLGCPWWIHSDHPLGVEAEEDLLGQEDNPFFQEGVVEEEEGEIKKFINVQQFRVLRNLLMYNFV